ncbi:uncharacterized protein LOC120781705 isoform X3 [Bactrocera tryoni]|uniref:uncharacterized protein LOC120781705 isoform X3 n=1 Tax=Bactrocera tryoni TaxID=59916 RepID=UPI001A963C68|nr:uncharacterized protein LOC120781705 isoform X3 [Bactrocera tryoni]
MLKDSLAKSLIMDNFLLNERRNHWSKSQINKETSIPYAIYGGKSLIKEYNNRYIKTNNENEHHIVERFSDTGTGENDVKTEKEEMAQTSQNQTRVVAPVSIPSNYLDPSLNKTCSRPAENLPLKTSTLSNDRTDIEIIVTNPHYQPTAYMTSRPNTTRHKLLRDLSHTALSSNEEIYTDHSEYIELETNRKKEYQRDLMEQIVEKRRTVQLLREKERIEDEALTRRLQEQLKSIHLEEQLAKKNIFTEKDTKQNRLMRSQLLAKLENDANMLFDNKSFEKGEIPADTGNGSLKNSKCYERGDVNKNKVYKYFTNSTRQDNHHYNSMSSYTNIIHADKHLAEKKCFHLSEKICSKCDEPLKSYERCCLYCQERLYTNEIERGEVQSKVKDNVIYCDKHSSRIDRTYERENCRSSESFQFDESDMEKYTYRFVLVCHKCERIYIACQNCVVKKAVCRACHRKLNICMRCRRNLCNICRNKIATGQNTDRIYTNDTQANKQIEENHLKQGVDSFRILNLNTTPNIAEDGYNSSLIGTVAKDTPCHQIKDNLGDEKPQVPHLDSIEVKCFYLDEDENSCIDGVRHETDKHLSRYMKNYGDVARLRIDKECSKSESRHFGTQTINSNLKRRDIMLKEEHYLSMPLLREMPKMTRKQLLNCPEMDTAHRTRKLNCIKQKWEVPAVQKCIITQNSHTLTQVGAIRKQLQAECLSDAQIY